MSTEDESQELLENKETQIPISKSEYISDSESEDIDINSDESRGYQKSNKERLQKIIDQMNDEELLRYESFRRSGFPKNSVRKLVNSVLGQACNPNFIISVSGIAKVFVGEMIEMAKEVQEEWKDVGPLMPSHIHEAHRRLQDIVPNLKISTKKPW